MRFDIHLSRNFKGGQYLKSFNANSSTDVLGQMKDCWSQSGVNNTNAEAFLFADIDGSSNMHELGTFAFDSDDDLSWEMNLDDADKLSKWTSLGYEADEFIYGHELFEHFIGFILSK